MDFKQITNGFLIYFYSLGTLIDIFKAKDIAFGVVQLFAFFGGLIIFVLFGLNLLNIQTLFAGLINLGVVFYFISLLISFPKANVRAIYMLIGEALFFIVIGWLFFAFDPIKSINYSGLGVLIETILIQMG